MIHPFAAQVLAGYLVAKLCRRLRRSRDRRSWGGDEPPSKCSRFFDACKLRLVTHGAGGAGERPSGDAESDRLCGNQIFNPTSM